jgi:hypothetical protein
MFGFLLTNQAYLASNPVGLLFFHLTIIKTYLWHNSRRAIIPVKSSWPRADDSSHQVLQVRSHIWKLRGEIA